MSTQERTDDPGEHGYGAAKKDSENLIGEEEDAPDPGDPTSVEANPSRRHRRYELDADQPRE